MSENTRHNTLQLETKDKFDALLKHALNSKNIKNARNRILVHNVEKNQDAECLTSRESSLKSSKKSQSHHEKIKIVQAEVYEQIETNKDFILNKFFNDSANTSNFPIDEVLSLEVNEPDVVFIKPPVPRPRKNVKASSLVSSVSRDGTYILEVNTTTKENVDIEQPIRSGSVVSDIDEVEGETTDKINILHEQCPSDRAEFATVLDNTDNVNEKQDCFDSATQIIIHKADYFNLDLLRAQLTVKVHIVNRKTGEYIQCSNKDDNGKAHYIGPITTKYNSVQEHYRSLTPRWEESLNVEEDINYILKKQHKPILFFEILNKLNGINCNKIAWAFLNLLGKNGRPNIEKRMRLQLYYPDVDYKTVPMNICNMYHWWKGKKLIKYPSTLYISIRSIMVPSKLHQTKESVSFASTDDFNYNNGKVTPWKRLHYQAFKLPNRCIAELPTYDEGCLIMKFSNNSLYLAYAVLIDDVYSVAIISTETFKKICRYSAHQGLIYSIAWSKDDQIIVTASADCTVCVWSFVKQAYIEMLPHPSYVYAAMLGNKNLIATGSFDKIVRIWTFSENDELTANLSQELGHHEGYITSVCFNKKCTTLYSADSVGVIVEWTYTNIWNIRREIKLIDLRDTVINQILLHTRERRIIIHARDSTLRIIDLKTGCVLHWLRGGLNVKFQSMCSLSPCGTLVVAGSESGSVNVWNIDTGHQIASYSLSNNNNVPILCVECHPQDNMIAVARYSANMPIFLLVYDPLYQNINDVGLLLLETNKKTDHSVNTFKSTALTVLKRLDTSKKNHKFRLEEVIQKLDQIIVDQVVSSTSFNTNIE